MKRERKRHSRAKILKDRMVMGSILRLHLIPKAGAGVKTQLQNEAERIRTEQLLSILRTVIFGQIWTRNAQN